MMYQIVSTGVQFLIIPLGILMYRYFKKQNEIARDMIDIKKYVKAICKKEGIFCTLETGIE